LIGLGDLLTHIDLVITSTRRPFHTARSATLEHTLERLPVDIRMKGYPHDGRPRVDGRHQPMVGE